MPWPRFITHVTRESFFLIDGNPEDFVLAKWGNNPYVYAVWSTLCYVYIFAMVIYTALRSEYGIKIIIWLTYWCFYSVALRFAITASNCWIYIYEKKGRKTNTPVHKQENDTSQNVPRELKGDEVNPGFNNTSGSERKSAEEHHVINGVEEQPERDGIDALTRENGQNQSGLTTLPLKVTCQWFLQNISNCVTILVTVLYWFLVYTGEPQDYSSITTHVLTSLLVTADIMVSRAPIRIQHFHIPLSYLAIYICFTLVYWAAGGTNHNEKPFIYNILDYSKRPGVAALAICLTAIIGILMIQIYLYFLHRVRNALFSCRRVGGFSLYVK